ncbi:unnamed protein product [Prunus armeniaca]
MIATTGDHIWAKTQLPKFKTTPFQTPKGQWSSKHSDVDSGASGDRLARIPSYLPNLSAQEDICPMWTVAGMAFRTRHSVYSLLKFKKNYVWLDPSVRCRIGIRFFKDFKGEFEAGPFRNFLSSTSACVKLVDHIHQAMILAVLKSFIGEVKGSGYHFAPKGVIFVVEAIQNLSVIALSSTQLNELTKIVDLTRTLSAEQICHETRMSKMKESMSMLKSSFAKKYSELNSSTDALHGHKEAYFHLERKNADIFQSYDELLANGAAPCHSIEDEDVEMFYLDMPPTQDVQINVVDIKATKELVVDETTVEEHNAKAARS